MKVAILLCALAGAAVAQSRTVVVTQGGVVVSGGRLAFLSDGGCTAQPEFSVDEIRADARARPFNGARCGGARAALQKAAELDARVGDGGQP